MKKIMGYKEKHVLQNMALAATMSFSAVFCIPNIINWSIGASTKNVISSFVGLAVTCVISFMIIMLLSYDRCNSSEKVMGRVLGTIAVLLFAVVMLSLLCGIIACLLYFLLRRLLHFDQIKGIIDFITTIMVMLTMPLAVSVFWQSISAKEGLRKGLRAGITLTGKQYVQMLILMLGLFGCGLLITTMFHFVQTNLLTNIVRTLLFTLLGAIGMCVSEKIVK